MEENSFFNVFVIKDMFHVQVRIRRERLLFCKAAGSWMDEKP